MRSSIKYPKAFALGLFCENFQFTSVNFSAKNSKREKLQIFLHAIFSMKKFENKVEFFVNNMSTKDAYVIIFSDF